YISLSSIHQRTWYCKYCQNMFQREKFTEHNANAIASRRVTGVDPLEEITQDLLELVIQNAIGRSSSRTIAFYNSSIIIHQKTLSKPLDEENGIVIDFGQCRDCTASTHGCRATVDAAN
ncbi:hypothetical protein Pfo_008227, partial [Paulownia fortunei]